MISLLTNFRIDAKLASDVEGQASWYALYFRDDLWRLVYDEAGDAKVYMTLGGALQAAARELEGK